MGRGRGISRNGKLATDATKSTQIEGGHSRILSE